MVSTICRGSRPWEPSGHLYVVDLEHGVQGFCTVPPAPHLEREPNPRGGIRGGRGLAADGDTLFVANGAAVLRFDRGWRPLATISHPWCGNVHDIAVRDERLWVCSTANDALAVFDPAGRLTDLVDLRPAALLAGDGARFSSAIDYRDPSGYQPAASNLLHANGIGFDAGGVPLVSLGQSEAAGGGGQRGLIARADGRAAPLPVADDVAVPIHNVVPMPDGTVLTLDSGRRRAAGSARRRHGGPLPDAGTAGPVRIPARLVPAKRRPSAGRRAKPAPNRRPEYRLDHRIVHDDRIDYDDRIVHAGRVTPRIGVRDRAAAGGLRAPAAASAGRVTGAPNAVTPPVDVAAQHARYDRHPDDRVRLFETVAAVLPRSAAVLYPGSFIDIGPSVWFDHVTYVDTDRHAARFFAQAGDVGRLITSKRMAAGAPSASAPQVRFHGIDYRRRLPFDDRSIDLLVSLYAGFVSEYCTRYLRPGGILLANNSHGDASLASLDPGYALCGVITCRGGRYRVTTGSLAAYLVPKRGFPATADELHRNNRGIAYTRAPFAYLFRRSTSAC